jgi:hypothetical protein
MLRVLVIFVFVEFDVRLVDKIFVVWIAFAAYTLLVVTNVSALEVVAFMVGAFTLEEAVTTVADIVFEPAKGPYRVVPEIDEPEIVLEPVKGPYIVPTTLVAVTVDALIVLLPAIGP